MITIRVILWKIIRRGVGSPIHRYVAQVLYVDTPDSSMMYTQDGYLVPALSSFEDRPDIRFEQVSDQEAYELLECLRAFYEVIVVRAALTNPPNDVIISHTDLLDRI